MQEEEESQSQEGTVNIKLNMYLGTNISDNQKYIQMNAKSKFPNLMGNHCTAAIRFISVRFAEIPNNVKQVDITPQITSLCNDNFPAHFPKLETYCF